jgi:MraZ protein
MFFYANIVVNDSEKVGIMFEGSSYYTIDAKGRMMLPPQFRSAIQGTGIDHVIVTGLDGGLVAYTHNIWLEKQAIFDGLTKTSDHMRRFRRLFIGNASKCTLDKQGRILIPQTLRDYADLKKETVLVGVNKHFEIWSKSRFEEQAALFEKDMQKEEVQEEIANLGL